MSSVVSKEAAAYGLSRALYRRLSQYVEERRDAAARQVILDACEMTARRLVAEPHFARPAQFLFEEIRSLFPLDEQHAVRRTIEVHLALARDLIERLPSDQRECGAFTRAGEQCLRLPVEGSEFCPSHRHLEVMTSKSSRDSSGASHETR